MLTLQCPKCGQALRLLERHLGVKGKCLKCAEPIIAERDEDSEKIKVLLLTQQREKQAVVTPIESARAEWTPFEMAVNESGTFPVMNTNDPSPLPAVSPFGDLESHDSKENSNDAVTGKGETNVTKAGEENEKAAPESESAAENPKPLGGFSGALFSKDSLPPAINAADSADTASAEDQAESLTEDGAPIPTASKSKSSMPPLPGIAGVAAFPVADKQESKVDEDSAGSAESAAPEPRFSNAVDPDEIRGDKSKTVPWMDLLAGKADTESTGEPVEDDLADAAAGAPDPVEEKAKATEPDEVAEPDEKPVPSLAISNIAKDADQADIAAEEETKADPAPKSGSSAVGDDDGESRTKLNWAAGLKNKANQMPSLGSIGMTPNTDTKVEPKAAEKAEPAAVAKETSSPAADSAPAEGGKEMGFDYFSSREDEASSKADKVAAEPEKPVADDSKSKPAEPAKANSKSDNAIEGADPSVTSVPKVNKVRERRKRRKRRRLIGAFLFLVVPAVGIGSLMYFKPAFRSQQLQPALMAMFDEGKGQITDSEKKFDIHSIVAPIKELWTQGVEPTAEPPGDAGTVVADVVEAPESTGTKPVNEATEETLVAADTPPAHTAGGETVKSESESDAPAVVDVAVATSTDIGPAATVDGPIVGGASPTDDVELTRAGPGENDETRRVRTEGEAILKQFYAARSAEGKLAYVLDPGSVAAAIEDAFPSPVEIPSIRSMAFKGRLVDSSTKRVFGVFDIRENENGDRHRWCVPEIAPDQFKIDWELYQQLADDELTRFLATPDAVPETFRLLIRRGPEMSAAERPWNESTLEMHLLMPLDDGKPSRVLITRSMHDELGFDSDLPDGAARVGKVQLGWKESATEQGLKVPTITAFERWGAWE